MSYSIPGQVQTPNVRQNLVGFFFKPGKDIWWKASFLSSFCSHSTAPKWYLKTNILLACIVSYQLHRSQPTSQLAMIVAILFAKLFFLSWKNLRSAFFLSSKPSPFPSQLYSSDFSQSSTIYKCSSIVNNRKVWASTVQKLLTETWQPFVTPDKWQPNWHSFESTSAQGLK